MWCPFDLENSQYVQVLTKAGFSVIHSHISEGKDFFKYQPTEHYDIIISNGPFSQKDAVLRRLRELRKPFAVLFPIATLQGRRRFPYLKGHNIQYLGFDKRINFFSGADQTTVQKGIAFGTCYLCSNFLPHDLIIEELEVN